MKRALFQNVKAFPYTSDEVIDRSGFLSAVVAVAAADEGDVKLEVTHADTAEGKFVAVPDTELFVGCTAEAKGLSEKDIANFDLDLLGCKPFIKVKVSGSAAGSCAVALGDSSIMPV